VRVPLSLYLWSSTGTYPDGAQTRHDGPPAGRVSIPQFLIGCTYGQSTDRGIREEMHREVLNDSPKFPDEIVKGKRNVMTRLLTINWIYNTSSPGLNGGGSIL
jgi:hypothetical protein